MGDPRIPQGNLNRIKASLIWVNFPSLNINSSFLGQEGLSLTFEGQATGRIPTMTGIVNSPEAFQGVMVRAALLKTQSLSAQYETQRQTDSVLGDCTVRPDVPINGGLQQYPLLNMSIDNIEPLSFNGTSAGYMITFGGYMLINQNLWN